MCSEDDFALIGREDFFTFGSVRKIDGVNRACGLIIFEVRQPDENNAEAVAVIRWLYVDENLRGMHIGDELMAAMYHILNLSGVQAVNVDISMTPLLTMMICDFLTKWWIYFSPEPVMELSAPLTEIGMLTGYADKVNPNDFASLEDSDEELFAKEIGYIMKTVGEDYELTDTDRLEPSLSAVKMVNGKPQCFMLVDLMPSGNLSVRRMAGISDDHKPYLALIGYVAKQALLTYDTKKHVFIKPASCGASNRDRVGD